MGKYTTIIFDLDGTLLNTLVDLKNSTNYALARHGMPERSIEEVRRFVGNGVEKLMERAVPDGKENPEFEEAFSDFKAHYTVHCNDNTSAYPGITDMLAEAVKRGYKLAIVSNKYYKATQELAQRYFKDYISVAIGERTGIRKKPAPDTVVEAMRELGSIKEECIYAGDSEVDIQTAGNAGIPCITVTWGFRTHEEQIAAGAVNFAEEPMQILELADRQENI